MFGHKDGKVHKKLESVELILEQALEAFQNGDTNRSNEFVKTAKKMITEIKELSSKIHDLIENEL